MKVAYSIAVLAFAAFTDAAHEPVARAGLLRIRQSRESMSKLTAEDDATILYLFDQGVSQGKLAMQFNVSVPAVSKARKRAKAKTSRHYEPEQNKMRKQRTS